MRGGGKGGCEGVTRMSRQQTKQPTCPAAALSLSPSHALSRLSEMLKSDAVLTRPNFSSLANLACEVTNFGMLHCCLRDEAGQDVDGVHDTWQVE